MPSKDKLFELFLATRVKDSQGFETPYDAGELRAAFDAAWRERQHEIDNVMDLYEHMSSHYEEELSRQEAEIKRLAEFEHEVYQLTPEVQVLRQENAELRGRE